MPTMPGFSVNTRSQQALAKQCAISDGGTGNGSRKSNMGLTRAGSKYCYCTKGTERSYKNNSKNDEISTPVQDVPEEERRSELGSQHRWNAAGQVRTPVASARVFKLTTMTTTTPATLH